MKQLETFEELAFLEEGTVVWNIFNGDSRKYWVLKYHEKFGLLYLIDGGDVRSTKSLYKTHSLSGVWLTGDYVSSEVGGFILNQLLDRIDLTKRIYLKEK